MPCRAYYVRIGKAIGCVKIVKVVEAVKSVKAVKGVRLVQGYEGKGGKAAFLNLLDLANRFCKRFYHFAALESIYAHLLILHACLSRARAL